MLQCNVILDIWQYRWHFSLRKGLFLFQLLNKTKKVFYLDFNTTIFIFATGWG